MQRFSNLFHFDPFPSISGSSILEEYSLGNAGNPQFPCSLMRLYVGGELAEV